MEQRAKRQPATRAICGAESTDGGLCYRGAGKSTDHEGVGRCSAHGGNSPNGIKAAGVTIARALGSRVILTDQPVYGMPERMAPPDALLWCVAIAAGEVRYLSKKVAELTEDEVLGRPATITHVSGEGKKMRTVQRGPVEPHIWVRERHRAVDRLARVAKMAMDAGVAERLVALAEFQATALAELFGAVFKDIGLTAAQMKRAEPVLERRLLAMESGKLGAGGAGVEVLDG